MHCVNYLDSDNNPCCQVTFGCKDLELFINRVYHSNYSIVNIIPLNHIASDKSPLFTFVFKDNNTSVITDSLVHFYDIHKYLSPHDKTLIRILPL